MTARNATTDLAATLAINLRTARKAAGLTQHGLAVLLERGDAMTVSRWERGEHRPSDERLIACAAILGRPVSWFYTDHTAAETTEATGEGVAA
jgi:transcriptional regulator with XRE-family HTH domain